MRTTLLAFVLAVLVAFPPLPRMLAASAKKTTATATTKSKRTQNTGGEYKNGSGSSHKGGKYKNTSTNDHYQTKKNSQ
ncbi:MAG: hypothetical protein ACLQBJ_07440 [Bryobacteraceae bacterium]